jgi:hydrogenase expression/formation protein HypE
VDVAGQNARAGDVLLVSGTLGDHVMTILSKREGLAFESTLRSDVAPLNGLVNGLLAVCPNLPVLRDPTRGGLATTLNEIAGQSRVSMEIWEETLPVSPEVQAAAEILGLDPLYLANEGKLVAVVPEAAADEVLTVMRRHPYGREGVRIGRVLGDNPGRVFMKTAIGGRRLIDMLTGEQLPRIC